MSPPRVKTLDFRQGVLTMKETIKIVLKEMPDIQRKIASELIDSAICMINPQIKGNSITDEMLEKLTKDGYEEQDIKHTIEKLEKSTLLSYFKIDLSGCHVRYIMRTGVKTALRQALNDLSTDPPEGMKRLYFQCECKATYASFIDVPGDISLEDALELAKANKSRNPITGPLQAAGGDVVLTDTAEFI